MKPDIKSREDIKVFVDSFYLKVGKDEILSPIFNGVANVNWEAHLPKMYDFWESILFGTGSFKGSPMQKHYKLHAKYPFKEEAFARWKALFNMTIDEYFYGEVANQAKTKALSIATVTQIKLMQL